MDLKAVIFSESEFVRILAFSGFIVFVVGYLLVNFGGYKRFRGWVDFTEDRLVFKLKKATFDVFLTDIEKIQLNTYMCASSDWKFKTKPTF